MDDSALVTAHQTGDAHALGVLMQRHQPGLMGFLTRRVGSEAEDLYQETWSRASKGLDTYRERGTFKAWLYQIARRLIIDHRRRKGSRIDLVLGSEWTTAKHPRATQPDQHLAANQTAEVLEKALCDLPEEISEVVRLRLIHSMPFKDIAEHQGIPLNTALGRMHRALQRLRKDLIDAELLPKGRPS
jgi:RNA polymerase sigma-70 factor (ECF subfamily)